MLSEAPSASEQLALNLYAALMREVKARISAIQDKLEAIRAGDRLPHAFLEAEFCFLQVRMICELVALSSISAHSPVGLGKKVLKSWHAERMFTELAHVNPHCFPQPLCVDSWNAGHVSFGKGRFMTLHDLRKIYESCGEHLHRGTAKPLLEGRSKNLNIKWIRDWSTKFVELLSNHIIYIQELDMFFVASMNSEPDGEVGVHILKSVTAPRG